MEPEPLQTYKIGDYIYVELQNSREPFWICKIEEIQKMEEGDTQIKVKLFYRRRHVEEHLLTVADKYTESFLHDEVFDWDLADEPEYNSEYVKLHYKLLQRYLFVTKENIIISPDIIRGHCYVFLLTTVDSPMDVLTDDDKFFFLLAYDPRKQEVHEDKGSIMYGTRYQAELPECTRSPYSDLILDTPIWDPSKCSDLTYTKLKSMTRSLHAFKDLTNSNPKTSLSHVYRDSHLFRALEILKNTKYDLNSAALALVHKQSCMSDAIESWNSDEILIFERALLKYGKQFHYIRQEFLPWKSWGSIITFYYLWKGSEGYKLWKQNYNCDHGDVKEIQVLLKDWIFPNITEKYDDVIKCPGCCKMPRNMNWYSWGPLIEPFRICRSCSIYWKRYSGFPDSPELESKIWQTTPPSHPGMPHSELFMCHHASCIDKFKSKTALNRHKALVHKQQCSGSLFLCTDSSVMLRKCLSKKTLRHMARQPCLPRISRN